LSLVLILAKNRTSQQHHLEHGWSRAGCGSGKVGRRLGRRFELGRSVTPLGFIPSRMVLVAPWIVNGSVASHARTRA
jgi:hypothetical protein